MQVPNEEYKVTKTATRAGSDAVAAGAGGGAGVVLGTVLVNVLRSRGVAPWGPDLDGAVVGLVATGLASAVAGFKRWRRNRAKHAYREVFNPNVGI